MRHGRRVLRQGDALLLLVIQLVLASDGGVYGRDLEVLELHKFTPAQFDMLWDKAKDALGDVGKSDKPSHMPMTLKEKVRSCCRKCALSDKASAGYIVIPKGANSAIRCNLELNENFSWDPVGEHDFPPINPTEKVLKPDTSGVRLHVPCGQSKYKVRHLINNV
eukprot:9472146-Pyramimonas_sp.AAC.1